MCYTCDKKTSPDSTASFMSFWAIRSTSTPAQPRNEYDMATNWANELRLPSTLYVGVFCFCCPISLRPGNNKFSDHIVSTLWPNGDIQLPKYTQAIVFMAHKSHMA